MKQKKVVLIFTVFLFIFLSSISLATTSDDVTAEEETVNCKFNSSTTEKKAIPIYIVVGKESVLRLNKPAQCLKQVSLADKEIADLKPLMSLPKSKTVELVFYGKKPGITSMIIWDIEENKTFFDVIVHEQPMDEFKREKIEVLEEKIKSIAPDADIKAEFAGDTIVLSGTAKNRQILDKIEKFAMLYASKGCTGISRSSSLPRSSEESKAEATAEEVKPGTGFVSVDVQQQTVQQTKPPVEALCVLNLMTIPEAQQIILEVKVAQINRTKLKELGISFIAKGIQDNAEITAPGLFTSPTGNIGGSAGLEVTPGIENFQLDFTTPQIGFAHFPSGVAVVLRALQEKGYGKILAEPNLVVRSGENGEFHVGTRVPIQTVYGVGVMAYPTITFEEVGVRLNFAPEVLETGAIRLTVDPAEVSSIVRYLEFLGIVAPEIDTRTVRTSVDLREGESLILAGLLSEQMRKNIQKVPILGDIPILGALFRSTKEELEETELAFFITPRLVKPMAPGVMPELPTDGRPTPDEEKEFEWIPVPRAAR